MSDDRLGFGDRVRHPKRPEWGIGSVVRAEDVAVDGEATQRLSVRFPNAGLKTLTAAHAALEVVEEPTELTGEAAHESVAAWKKVEHSEWLAPVAEKKIEEAMLSIPVEARDPFRSLRERLIFALNLYRFERNGAPLLDWAVAQSGLDDPLSRFTRQELEVLFDRWADTRDEHVGSLLRQADSGLLRQLADDAPPTARGLIKRMIATR